MIPPHPLRNFEIHKYYQNEPKLNVFYSRDNLPKRIKDGGYVINLDGYADVGTPWIASYNSNIEIIYFVRFGVENGPEETKKIIGNKNIKINIFRIPANDSIVCGYFCIVFIGFIFAAKTLIDYISLFSPYDFEKNDNIILNYFKNE